MYACPAELVSASAPPYANLSKVLLPNQRPFTPILPLLVPYLIAKGQIRRNLSQPYPKYAVTTLLIGGG